MAIISNQTATILPNTAVHYNAADFEQHKDSRFIEVSAYELLTSVKPIRLPNLPDEEIIAVDTETWYTGVAIDYHHM